MLMSKFDDKWGMLSFFLLLLFMGLFYQVAWQYPVIDSYPLIERLLDPGFLPNDFYTNTFKEFSPRLASAKAIVWLSGITGMDYKDVVAYGNVIRIWLYGAGLYLLFLNLSDIKTALVAFSFAALSFLSMPFLPAWWPISYDLTSSNIAMVAAIFAWAFAVKGAVRSAFLLLTITVFVHPVVGIQAMLISILIYTCINGWKALFDLFITPSIYPFAILFCAAFLFNYFSYEQVLSNDRFIDINGQYRHGHHFIVSHMDIEKWLSTFLMCALCIGITLWFKRNGSTDKLTMLIIYYSGAMIILGFLFTEIYPTRFMTSFIPMRAFPILVPIILLSFAKLAIWEWEEKNYLNFFLLFLPFLPFNHVGLTWYLLPDHHEVILPMIVTVIVFVLIIVNRLKFLPYGPINQLITIVFKNSNVGLFILPIALLAALLAVVKFNIFIPTQENSASIYRWLNENTSSNDVIVAELNAANNQKIRLISRRAVVASKDFPFNELFYEEWYKKYSDLYIHRDKSRGRIDSLNADELNVLLDTYEARILVRSKKLETTKHFEFMGESDGENKPAFIYKNMSISSL